MELQDSLRILAEKIRKTKDKILTEEATKMAYVVPFFRALGYEVDNPIEFVPEFTADIANKKGEKVDFAIMFEDAPQILIEAKSINDTLDKHDPQLARYFQCTNAQIGILTNGSFYKFFAGLEEQNRMDQKPFLELDLLDLKEYQVNELKKFCKDQFNVENILSGAEELKYLNSIKATLQKQFVEPGDKFIEYMMSEVYEGRRTKNLKEVFAPIVKKGISQVLNDMIKGKLEDALKSVKADHQKEESEATEQIAKQDETPKIETTQDEILCFCIYQAICGPVCAADRLSHKDTVKYFGINVTDESGRSRWISRLKVGDQKIVIDFPKTDTSEEERIQVSDPAGLYKISDKILSVVSYFMEMGKDGK